MVNPAPVHAADVIRLLGEVDASTVEGIVETGGSFADLELAYFRLMGQDDWQKGESGPLEGKAALIFDILVSDPIFAPTEDR